MTQSRLITSALGLAAALALFAGPAVTQERTVASAHAFLTRMIPGSARVPQLDGYFNEIGYGVAIGSYAGQDCQSTLVASSGGGTWTIDWRRVNSVTHTASTNGAIVFGGGLPPVNGEQYLRLELSSLELGRRVEAAFDFLRKQCAGAEGF